MTDFKAKMRQIRFRLGLCPRPRWGSLQRSPRPPSWIWGALLLGKGREGRVGEERRGKGWGEEGREGKGKGHEPPPQYLEEVYVYVQGIFKASSKVGCSAYLTKIAHDVEDDLERHQMRSVFKAIRRVDWPAVNTHRLHQTHPAINPMVLRR